MADLRRYDPSDVKIIFGGFPLQKGIVKGTFITVRRNDSLGRVIVGSDGETTRVMSSDRTGMIQLTIASSSQTNTVLSAIAAADAITGAVALPFLIADFSGQTLVSALTASLSEIPPIAFIGEGVSSRTWTFDATGLSMFGGGSNGT